MKMVNVEEEEDCSGGKLKRQDMFASTIKRIYFKSLKALN